MLSRSCGDIAPYGAVYDTKEPTACSHIHPNPLITIILMKLICPLERGESGLPFRVISIEVGSSNSERFFTGFLASVSWLGTGVYTNCGDRNVSFVAGVWFWLC